MNLVFSFIILSTYLFASFLSFRSSYWFLPLVFAPISMIGYLKKKTLTMDGVIAISIISYALLNYNLTFNLLNLLSMIGILFFFISVWIFGRHLILLDLVENNSRKGSIEEKVNRLERSTVYKILGNVFLGAILTSLATIMGRYGSLESIQSGQVETILMLIFTSALFLIVYLNINFLSSKEN